MTNRNQRLTLRYLVLYFREESDPGTGDPIWRGWVQNLSAEPELTVSNEKQYFSDLEAVPALIREGANEAVASLGGAQ